MNVSAISSANSINFQGRSADMTEREKQELILKARTKAAGYAFFGGAISTLYYALRSDEKVARKFDLDVYEDKDLVKQIKKEQVKWTLPAALTDIIDLGATFGLLNKKSRFISFAVGAGAYLYNKCFAKAKDIEIE